MNLLLTGPPASGKSYRALERFRSIDGSYLVVPTATMAEHLRHQLARSGYPVRPSRIVTLAQLLDGWPIPKAAPAPFLHSLVERCLEELHPPRFADVAGQPGVHAALASLLEEAPSLRSVGRDFAEIQRYVEDELRKNGFALRHTLLHEAAAAVRHVALPPHLVFDGFFTFSHPEAALLVALGETSSVTVTLPSFPSAEPVRARLLAAGFTEERFTVPRRAPVRHAFSAATADREAEEIARRILERHSAGVAFREMAVILRTRDPYGPAVETALARFGIPTRSYFAASLASHPAIAYLAGVMRALESGWDQEQLVALVRMPVSGWGATPAGDQLDFDLRKKMPGRGLPSELNAWKELEPWRRGSHTAQVWAERLKGLTKLLPAPVIEDGVPREQVFAWRSTSAALEAFTRVLDEAATALQDRGPLPLATFWKHVETALSIEPLRVPDRRRDVVHILDVHEARQWELPVVFVCGMLERDFPQYHREDPLLGDAVRQRLGMSTASARQQEERSLFDLAVTRATREVILSFARFDEKGQETLPSFFLSGQDVDRCDVAVRVSPTRRPEPGTATPRLEDAGLAERHKTLSPTSIESFLQCPFQFFAQKTLRLKERPPAPRDRLDLLVQGSILHEALAEWSKSPLLGSAVFQDVFEAKCRKENVPRTYRTEAVRLELLRHFEGFLADRQVDLGWSTETELSFEMELAPGLGIRGRIDRLDTGPGGHALVIDYKYSAGNKIRERVDESESGNLVQGGLYLLAARNTFHRKPAGMLYCGLKKDVTWHGWHVSIPGLATVGESRTPEALAELMRDAEAKAREVHSSVLAGEIAARPADTDKCRWCNYRDICRVESLTAITGAAGA